MSIYHVTDSKGGGPAVDRTLFVGPKIPPEIKTMSSVIQSTDKATVRKALQLIARDLEGQEVSYESFQSLQGGGLEEEKAETLYVGLLLLVKLALRHPKTSLKQEVFKEDLKELKIPEEHAADIASLLFGGKRTAIESNLQAGRPRLPSLDSLRWKVDVTISTSVINRVLEPTIMMEMVLSDGKLHQFEVPVSQFHELRYSVAHVLKEMEDLERRSILQIQD